MAGKRPRTERTQCVVVDNGRRGIDGCGSGTADGRRPRGVPILESVLLEPRVKIVMRGYIVYDGYGECREPGKPWARFEKSHKGLESAIEHAQLVHSAVLYEDSESGESEIVWSSEEAL